MNNLKLADFYKNKRNSEKRKEITLEVEINGEKTTKTMLISKFIMLDKPPSYVGSKSKIETNKRIYEMMLNHVFDVDTGQPLFNPIDIMEGGFSSPEEFFREVVPLNFILELAAEITEFSGLKPRQEEIDDIKN
ncbi:MAG: hypothetical protein FWG64_01545 [Firmicutes bacterium]|nr:hypothetical protein [Bacillota bacterium]